MQFRKKIYKIRFVCLLPLFVAVPREAQIAPLFPKPQPVQYALPPVPPPDFGDRNPMAWFHPVFSKEELKESQRELQRRQIVTELIHAFRYRWKGRIPSLLKRLAGLAPNSAEFYYFRALYEYRRGEKGKAWFLVEKSLAAWPEYARAWNLRGILLEESERYEEALHSFEKALHWAPFTPIYLFNTASLLYKSKRYEEARKRIAEALKSKSNLAEGYYLEAKILQKLSQNKAALHSFAKALEFGFQSDAFFLEYARLAIALKDSEKQTELLPYLRRIRSHESSLLQSQIHEGFGEYKKAAWTLGRVCRDPKASSPQLRRHYVELLAKTNLRIKAALALLPIKQEERASLLAEYQKFRLQEKEKPKVKDAILKPFDG